MGISTLRLIKRCAEFQPRANLSAAQLKVRGLYSLLRYRPRLKKYDVVYVGLTTRSVRSRLKAHSKSKRRGRLWTHFSVFEVREGVREKELRELEGLLRHIYRKDSRANRLNLQKRFRALVKVRVNDLRKWTPDMGRPRRHAYIARKALLLDKLIEAYSRARRLRRFPRKRAREIAALLFPGSSYADDGAYKTVQKVSSRARHLVLKLSKPENIRADLRAYVRLPRRIRNWHFTKIYWATKYCLLQKRGKRRPIPSEQFAKLREVAARYGLKDVRRENIRQVDGRFKIIDATYKGRVRRREVEPFLWRTVT